MASTPPLTPANCWALDTAMANEGGYHLDVSTAGIPTALRRGLRGCAIPLGWRRRLA